MGGGGGVNITRDLKLLWAKHFIQITMKTNNSLKLIKRNIQTNNPKLKESAYKTYVRPLVENRATVWYPWQKKYINTIEMIQNRAIRYLRGSSLWYEQQWSIPPHLGIHTRQKMSTAWIKSNVAQLALLTITTRNGTPGCVTAMVSSQG